MESRGAALVRGLLHGVFGAFADAFATFDAKGVIDYRISFGILSNGSDGA